MAKRISLREFQQDLTKRLAEMSSSGRRSALLAVTAGAENWLVDLSDAGEIIAAPALTEVPLTRNWFRGLANVRGNLYSVVDLAAFCGDPLPQLTNDSRMMLIGAKHGLHTALLVSRALGLRNPDDFELDESFADARPWIGAALRDNQNRLWKRLIVRPLLADPRFLDAGADAR
ncbi:MAG: twitching motility protein PilI [Candidatus Dactylopiibacterium carminicum]|uniref:Twitching motility protein PilI n=1 Tax=Candidatus Dactylopiibacterium carminicum TaxID=857335 RepID=A0A272EVA4_9RHOO|nr:chemotaxis protein CheW [Candidatus Dactylopiibacterium carminicum]KAF7600135.1 twitching motility protein PilI [Candidatus Dactylopiibacterium carminicum]PAS94035.1 MAG: twitching motility protein PilI [Candidatus Dactylopiibacterium carminicum]PAS98201.1 MAG: twitching motility protein PilI [Candidatus Dactylopiibacterium carminicum]PAT00134.1 MAG: twitching motility protein PilI [Candidatus Dactylopiibacterium carminicum]